MKLLSANDRRRAALLTAALLALAGPARAADDFDALLHDALNTHPAVQGQRAGLEAARFDKEGAQWQLFPTPSFESSAYNSNVGNSSILAVEQPIWTGGRISAGIRAAGLREAAAQAAVVEAKQAVALRVISAYTEVFRQQQRREYARREVDEHEKLLALIDRRVQQEVSPPADRDFAQARLAQAATDLSLALQGLQVAQAQLGQLVGRPVQEVNDVRLEGRAIPTTQEGAQARAVERSPILERLEKSAQAAVEDVNSRRAVILPQVSVRLESQLGNIASVVPDNRALLVVRAQPGAGLSAASAIAAAQSRYDQARLAKLEAERNVREQVQTAYAGWRAAQLRLESARLSAGMSQSVFDSYSRQYVAGRKSWIELLNAVREVSQSQFLLADAEALLRASALQLWLFVGEAPIGEPSNEVQP